MYLSLQNIAATLSRDPFILKSPDTEPLLKVSLIGLRQQLRQLEAVVQYIDENFCPTKLQSRIYVFFE